MYAQDLIPSDIKAIIESKRAALQEEKRQKEEAERQEAEQLMAKGKAMYEEFVQQALSEVPDYLRPYYDPSLTEEPDYSRLARGWDSFHYAQLSFSVPGLSKIKFSPRDKTWTCEYAYESQQSWTGDEYIWSEPAISFPRDYGWSKDLDYILTLARKQLVKYHCFVEQYTADEKERAAQREQDRATYQEAQDRKQAERAAADLDRQAAEQREQAEEAALFDAIRQDPIAILFLKAFVLIRDERSTFVQRLEDADDTIYSIENRWARRAEELHRQAEDAERRAEDERSRLQSDLDDAEAKLKKAERGW